MKLKNNKRALIMSALVLLLCLSMLIGSTFAWFTDVATSANNKIVAGTLDVQLLMHNGTEYEDISDSTQPIFGAGGLAQNVNSATLWEPGKTQVAYLAIKNNGNLALKYTVGLDVQNVSNNLYEVMQYAITPNAEPGDVTAWNANEGRSVIPGTQVVVDGAIVMNPGDVHYFALSIHMNEQAGSEYQGGEVNFDLTVLATQATVEHDSFDNTYDTTAWASDAVSLKNALEAGGTVSLINDIVLSGEVITIPTGTEAILNLNGYDITVDKAIDASVGIATQAFLVQGALTVEGEGDVTLTTNIVNNTNITASIFRNEGILTLNGGNYLANDISTPVSGAFIIVSVVDTCLYQGHAVTTINGGTYSLAGNAVNLFRNFPTHFVNASATLIINDGVFNKNPAKSISYIWNHQVSASHVGVMEFNGGTYNGIVYEDYFGQADVTISDAAIIGGLTAYVGNN